MSLRAKLVPQVEFEAVDGDSPTGGIGLVEGTRRIRFWRGTHWTNQNLPAVCGTIDAAPSSGMRLEM